MKNLQCKYPNKLKELRLKNNLTQRQVSHYLGFSSEERISRWEHGKTIPNIINMIKLGKLFKIKIEKIYFNFK